MLALSPALAPWITASFGITTFALRDLGLRDAEDPEIFEAAKSQSIIFITEDSDFVELVDRCGSPPQILWLTCGNTLNVQLTKNFEDDSPKRTSPFTSR